MIHWAVSHGRSYHFRIAACTVLGLLAAILLPLPAPMLAAQPNLPFARALLITLVAVIGAVAFFWK